MEGRKVVIGQTAVQPWKVLCSCCGEFLPNSLYYIHVSLLDFHLALSLVSFPAGILFAVGFHVGIPCPRKGNHDCHNTVDSPCDEFPSYGTSVYSHVYVWSLWVAAAVIPARGDAVQGGLVHCMDVWGYLWIGADTLRSKRWSQNGSHESGPFRICHFGGFASIYGSYPSNCIHAEWKIGILAVNGDIRDLCGGFSLVLDGILQPNDFWFNKNSLEIKSNINMIVQYLFQLPIIVALLLHFIVS